MTHDGVPAALGDQRWRLLLEAVATLGSDLSLDELLARIVSVAHDLVGARYAALGVIDEDGDGLATFVTAGLDEADVARIGSPPTGRGLLGLLIAHPEPLRLADLTSHPAAHGLPAYHPPMYSFLGVPVRVRERVFGNLYLTEKVEGDFTEADQEILAALAGAAGVAIENARSREDRQRLALYDERDRIGRDLHDLVIQRLFAIGLSLQGALRRLAGADPEVTGRIDTAVEDIDETIREIRRTIFHLGTMEQADDIQSEATRLVERAAAALKFRPSLSFEGPVRLRAGAATTDILAVLAEALANAARHAAANEVSVVLRADDRLTLTVRDDGQGLPAEVVESGLANMRRRAERHGGTCVVRRDESAGTVVEWSVPLA